MGVILGTNQYGKAEVRMVTVARDGDRHSLKDLTVGITLSGDLEDVHLTGENTNVVPTDTQKNTVFAFAREAPVGEIEDFALRLGRHFVGFEPIHRARVKIEEAGWRRIDVDGVPHDHSFVRGDCEVRSAIAVCEAEAEWVLSGLSDLVLLKSSGSEFRGFITDPYTTLRETGERILSTAVTARWRHATAAPAATAAGGWRESFEATRALLLERFAATHSRSLQQTLHAMAEAVLTERPEVVEMRMSMPNRHHFVVDLAPFGLKNDNEIFRVEDRPYGLIEAAVAVAGAPPAGPAWEPYPLL
ncbi:MAG: urate oxidase [Solirubrobacteraceae bacterium]|jgi:urate oxidase|nr:urate oxidase [Solirubrobacteraceae bacterium]